MRPFGDFDFGILAEALKRPGMDTRTWASYAIVDREQDDQHSVEFDPEWGPLVWVILQPSNQRVVCRVASGCAGNGEGEWHPFLQADEVLVVIPEGDTRAVPVIVGRLNNSYDKFPEKVAGKDTNLNNVGFMRRRGPFIIEGDSMMVMRSSQTGAMIGVDEKGNSTMRDGEGNVFQLGPHGVALQNKDGDMQIALDVEKRTAVVGAGGAVMRLSDDGGASQLGVPGTLELSTVGNAAVEHLVTLEQLVNILATVLSDILTAPMGIWPAPTGFPSRTAALGAISAALVAVTGYDITPALAGITAALQVPKPPATSAGQPMPGVGCIGLLGG